MSTAMAKYTLNSINPSELTELFDEFKRIKRKYNSTENKCEFDITKGEIDDSGGTMTVYLFANKAMIEAYITEQII